MERPRYFDRHGRPMGLMEWAEAMERPDRQVARTEFPTGGHVSTVWLGLNHAWGAGPPLIFETMVFDTGTGVDETQERYATEAEALAGHEMIVAQCKAALASRC